VNSSVPIECSSSPIASYDQLNGEGDGLEIAKQELLNAGVPAPKLDHVATLILMVLNDRVNTELAALRTKRIP
jgi:hypothetical protein